MTDKAGAGGGPPPVPFFKNVVLQSLSGGSAGFCEISLMQPLDVVKTRLQLQSHSNIAPEDQYTGIWDCIKKIRKNEGALAFYKGILPPMMVEIPKRAVKFMFFEQSIRFFLFGQEKPMPISYILAGVCSGIGEGTVINSFEVVKVQQQAARGKMADSESAGAVAKRIIAEHGFGLKGISRGYFATVWREVLFNIVYFGVYRSILDVLPVYPEKPKELFKKFICGFSCAILGCFFNTPFDMAKSTLQGPLGMVKYFSIWDTFKMAYAEEGLKGVYRGLGPRLLRIGPGGAIMLLVYDQVYGFLYRTFHYAGGP